jgi:hypothetical protein
MGVRERCCIHVAVALSAEAVIVQLEPLSVNHLNDARYSGICNLGNICIGS